MRLKAMKKVFARVLACMMLIPALAGFGSFAAETTTVEIVSNNVWYGETLNLMYAVKAENAEGYTFTVTANGETVGTYYSGKETIKGVECDVYIVTKGVAAQNIDTVYTATVTCGAASHTTTYSVLEYLNERLYVSEGVTDIQRDTYTSLITYAEKADAVLNEDNSISNLVYVNVEGGVSGMYEAGSTITATTDREPAEGKKLVWAVKHVSGAILDTIAVSEMTAGIQVTERLIATVEEIDADASELPEGEISISAAKTIGSYAGSAYTTEKYTVTGTITEVINTTYGNLYIQDAEGNNLYVYGLYSENGKTRYDAMTDKPIAGDTITVTGVLGTYNDVPQMKNGWMTNLVAHECTLTDADCLNPAKCTICGKESGEALGHNYVDGTCTACGEAEEIVDPETPAEPTELAVFEFGANGTASHNDGSDMGASKSYTENGYTLAITGASKVYTGARDAKGNSCLKFGTTKLNGSMTFTVPDNVTEVRIAVAKYKANATTVSVNGTTYSITGSSNDGAYDTITIDTSVTKTITFATVGTTYRCMVNSITFIG